MFLSKCSECKAKFEEPKLITPGYCQDHKFCQSCYDEASININFTSNCIDCQNFYYPSPKDEINFACTYCYSPNPIETICKSHKLCKNCLVYPCKESIKSCYNCFKSFKKMCIACLKISEKDLIACPCHLEHRYCQTCFIRQAKNKKFEECKICQKFAKKAKDEICYLCKGLKELQIFSCSHAFCSQCIYLIEKSIPEELLLGIEKCICLSKLKTKMQEVHCQLCFENKKKSYVQILTCPYKHVICQNCSRDPPFTADLISCEHCSVYFSESKHKTCLYCKKNKLKSIDTGCSEHTICRSCLYFIQKQNFRLYFRCQTCSTYMTKLFKNGYAATSNETTLYNNLKVAICKLCNISALCCNKCPNHFICKSCFNFRHADIENMQCESCKKLLHHACKGCFEIIENKFFNPACEFEHFYCKTCFLNFKDKKFVNKCQQCTLLYKKKQAQNCAFCGNWQEGGIKICNIHILCDRCSRFINNKTQEIFSEIVRCRSCKSSELFFPEIEESRRGFIHFSSSEDKDTKNESDGDKVSISRNTVNPRSGRNTGYFRSILNYTIIPIINHLQNEKSHNFMNIKNTYPAEKQHACIEKPQEKPKDQEIQTILQVEHQESIQCICSLKRKSKNKKSNKILCSENYWKPMSCGHAQCIPCLSAKFENDFEDFITKIINRDLESLNNQIIGIRCFNDDCYNNMCFPFMSFAHIAERILEKKSINRSMLGRYAMYFEGIKFNFIECPNCKYITGYYKLGETCMHCNLDLHNI